MGTKSEVRQLLTSRRAKITPGQAGLPVYGSNRRVPGLRREEVAAHNVRFPDTGVKHFHHPVVGDLSLSFDRMELSADAGLTIFAYTAEPGSRSEEALNLLASWAATLDQAEMAHAMDGG